MPSPRRYTPRERGGPHGRGVIYRWASSDIAAAVASIAGNNEERAVASLFTPSGRHAMKGESAGIHDFEVLADLLVVPEVAR